MGEDVGVRRRGGEQKGSKGGAGGEEKKAERPKPFQGRYNPKVLPTIYDKCIFWHKSIPGFRSLWISLPQELGQVRDALRRRLLPPLLQLQEGVRAVHRQGDGDSGEDSLSLDVVLSNLQGRDPGSRSSLPSCALWQDDLRCNCH